MNGELNFNKWLADEAEKLAKLRDSLDEQIAENVSLRNKIDALRKQNGRE